MNPFKRIKDPVEGSMHVVGCSAMDPEVMRAPCHITYVIQAEGVEPFSGDQVFELWSGDWPSPGDDLPVVFDREHPDRIQIQTEKLQSHAEHARQQADQLAEQLRAGMQPGSGAVVNLGGAGIAPIVIGNADPERVREGMARAEQMLGIDLDGDGVIGGQGPAQRASGVAAQPPASGVVAESPASGVAAQPPASAAAAQPQSAAGDDLASQLERLAALRDSGVLTADEFDAQKRRILGT